MFWPEKVFNAKKPIIGMCHLQPLPNDPLFDFKNGVNFIIEKALYDVEILQNEGINGILFSNEFSYPYTQNLAKVTVATMARIIGELRKHINIPYGVDCMYDAFSTIDLAIATDADFYRVTLNQANLYEYEFGHTQLGSLIRYITLNKLKAKNIVNIDSSVNLSILNNNVSKLIKSITTQAFPDAISISAQTIDKLLCFDNYQFDEIFEEVILICDGACNADNIAKILNHTNGAVIGTAFKENQQCSNPISLKNVKKIVDIATANNF